MSAVTNLTEWLVPCLFAAFGLTLKRQTFDDESNLREWSPPPSPPPTPVALYDRAPSKYSKRGKKNKKTYKSRYDIDLDALEDEDDEASHVSGLSKNPQQNKGIFSTFFCCGSSSAVEPSISNSSKKEVATDVSFEDEPVKPKSKYDVVRQNIYAGDEEGSEDKSLVHKFFGEDDDDDDDRTIAEDENTAVSSHEGKNGKKQWTDEERAEIERRKAKQAKRLRKKVEKKETEEFVEKVIEVHDPLARYHANFPPFGKLKGAPMSLDFMNSSHSKRAYDLVVVRKTRRLEAMKAHVMNGGVDTVAQNSGPDEKFVPPGFCISPRIPDLDMSFNGELVMILWEQEMNVDQFKQGDPALGWFIAKIHSHCNRPPYNFIMKYSKEVTGLRKLDGFVNTTLDPAGYHGYGRRWVWIRPMNPHTSTDLNEQTGDVDHNSSIPELLSLSNGANDEDDGSKDDDNNDNAAMIDVHESSPQALKNHKGYGTKLGTKENGGDRFNTNDRIE